MYFTKIIVIKKSNGYCNNNMTLISGVNNIITC